MKVEGYNIINTLEGQLAAINEPRPQSADNRYRTDEVYTNDSISLSQQAIEFNRIKNAIRGIPEIREDKVTGLIGEIGNGSYRVEAELIGPSLLREHIMDALLAGPPSAHS